MGRPSDRKHSARRLGKHERTLAKTPHYGRHWRTAALNVGGAGISYEIYAHGKKADKVRRYVERLAHHVGDSQIRKSGTVSERPLYKLIVA